MWTQPGLSSAGNWYQLEDLGQGPSGGNLCVIPRANSQGHSVLMEQGHI